MATVEILGQHVQITHLLAAFLCLVFGAAMFLSGRASGHKAREGGTGHNDADDDATAETTKKKKKKKRNRNKKKKKKKQPEPEPVDVSASEGEPSSDDDDDSSFGYSDEDDVEPQPPAAPAPAPKKKNNKNNKNNKNKGKGKGKSAQAAAKKGTQKQKSAGSFQPPKGYNPTPEDTRKRREREEKRRAKQQQSAGAGAGAGAAKSAKPQAANPAAAQAGKITKRGIIGLSRAMTKEDRGGNWETVGGDKKKKSSKSKGATTMATTNDPHARVIVVPTSKIGMIIGSGGLTLRKIEAETGCSVSMPQVAADAKPTANTRVTIRGEDEDMLREAVACVADLVNRGHSDLLYRGTDSKQSVFRLNSALHHILVGKGGATIRAIQDKSKCKVVLPSDKGSSKITIIGEPEGIKIVQEALKQIDRYCYCKLADPSLTHEEVEVSDSELGYIIGFKGHVIKSIQGDTNTKIYTPGKGRKNTNVIVVGTAANVNRAVKQIHRNIEKNTY